VFTAAVALKHSLMIEMKEQPAGQLEMRGPCGIGKKTRAASRRFWRARAPHPNGVPSDGRGAVGSF